MNKSKLIGLVVVVAVVIAGGAFLFIKRPPGSVLTPSGSNLGGGLSAQPKGFATREAAPQNIVVPDQNSKDVPEGVAVPDTVALSNPITKSSYRDFSVKVNEDKFIPDTIIVKAGDILHFDFKAIDKDYDFTQPDYGISGLVLAKGKTIPLNFGNTIAGKFTFYCSSCGGPESGPVGYIIAAP
jgi:plastocyanin